MQITTASETIKGFGGELRSWRMRRGLSQLDLALRCGTSQRHLSFLETGRARPSRGMVLALAGVLDVPLRHQNALLLAAGFAPAFRERALGTPELGAIDRAVGLMLAKQEPYPALIIDRRWRYTRGNAGAVKLFTFIAGGEPPPGANLQDALLAPQGMRQIIENWDEVATWTLRRAQAEAVIEGTPEAMAEMDRLLAFPGLPRLANTPKHDGTLPPVLTMNIVKDGVRLSLFSTIATLGTPLDVTMQDLRIETFFPADDATEAWFQGA